MKSLRSVEIFENRIYLASSKSNRIVAMDKYSLDVETVVSDAEAPFDLRIYHRQKQPEVPHPCRENNGGCEHFCLPMWKNNVAVVQCLCAQGYKQSETSIKQCVLISDEPLLLYLTRGFQKNMISAVTLPNSRRSKALHQAIIPVYNISSTMYFDVDEKEAVIYYIHSSVHE